MVWQYAVWPDLDASISATRIDVILITLLSLASLGIPYLWRAGVFGTGWNYAKTQDARILANAPYFVMVIVYLITAMVASAASDQLDTLVLGPAVAFGLAGAVLAAQPRSAELAPGDVRRDKRWVAIALGFAGIIALFTIVQILELLLQASLRYASPLIVIIMGAASAAILAIVALKVAQADSSWRLVGIGLGVTAAVFGMLSLSPQITLIQVDFDGGSPAFSFTFWIAFGAVIAAPSLDRLTKPAASGAAPWLKAVRTVLTVAIGLNALMGVVSIIALIEAIVGESGYFAFYSPIPWVVALFFGVIGVVGGIIVRAMLSKDVREGLMLTTGYAALMAGLGLVLVILWSVQHLEGISPLTMLIAFAVPLGLVVLLWGPQSVRQHFASLPSAAGAAASGFSFAGAGSTEQPGPAE
jgi:hypothetical protein